ncbi:MAG: AAA family ATPase, partial [bacterium]|nr:AAA family ATPase [bacterium]
LSHAYLFSGPESVGKFTLAKIFARGIINGAFLQNEIEKEEKLPLDLIILEPEIEKKKGVVKENSIKIEHIRAVQKDLSLFPYQGKKKVLIVNNAHKMKPSSQNALLKILEEPNETSIIILITHRDSDIISTIKSRCQKINFSLASVEELELFSKGNKNYEDIVLFSMGRPGLAVLLLGDERELDSKKEALKELKIFSSMGINERFKLAEKLSSNLVLAAKKLESWIWIIRLSIFKQKKTGSFLNWKTIEKISESLDVIKNTNASARLVLENLFLEL